MILLHKWATLGNLDLSLIWKKTHNFQKKKLPKKRYKGFVLSNLDLFGIYFIWKVKSMRITESFSKGNEWCS